MDRGDWLVVILLFLIPIPFINSNYLVKFSFKFMNEAGDSEVFKQHLIKFRRRQRVSALYTIFLFCLSVFLTTNFSKTCFQIHWLDVTSALFLTHSIFGKLGWEIQSFKGDTVIELVNEWWFRIVYSIGIILFFITMVR